MTQFLITNPVIYVLPPRKETLFPRYVEPDPMRTYHQFAFFTKGHHTFIVDGKKYNTTENSLLYLPKGHGVQFLRDEISECYHFGFFLLRDELYQPFVRNYKNSKQIENIFERLYVLNQKDSDETKRCAIMSLVYKLFALIVENENNEYFSSKHSNVIASSVDFIKENYLSQEISVPYLASNCKISTRYYTTLFTTFYGCSPKKFITDLKINYAKELLINSDKKIADISSESNFSDVYYFCKTFKKVTGVSPTEYRRSAPFNPAL